MRWLVLSLALIVGSAQSQEPTPTASKGGQKPYSHASASANKSNTDQRGTESVPLVVKTLVPEKSKEEAAREAEEHERKATFERWDITSTVVIAAFTVILGISTILLWLDTRGLRKLADKQSSDMRESLDIAKQSADAATKTAEVIETYAIRQTRAYVYLEILTFNWRIGTPKVTFKMANHGETPARNCRFRAAFRIFETDVIDFPGASENVDPNHFQGSQMDLPPKAGFAAEAILDHQPTAKEIAALEEHKLSFCVFGMIRYKDVFERDDRWTKFRFMSHKGMGLDENHMYACDAGNETT